jgi:recombination protein RecA
MERFKLLEDTAGGDLKADQGSLQKEQKRMLKMLQYISKQQNSIIMCSGHYYGKPSSYGAAEEVGGGNYMRLAPDIIVSLKKSKKYDTNRNIIGNDIKAITLKNRYYPPFSECVVEIDYKKGVNEYAGLLDIAMEMGLIKLGGAGWYSFGDLKTQGKEKAEKLFLEDVDGGSTGL